MVRPISTVIADLIVVMSTIHSTERDIHRSLECETSQRPAAAQNILIAVMGVTGAGKSYFIRDVSGLSTVVVGHSLGSCTSEVIEYTFKYAGITITLIDTPGFNDTKLSDTEVLTRITSWTQKRYNDHQLLSGIIFLHRITDVRMEGPSLKNLHMFEKLVGRDCLHNVLLTSTRWSEVPIEEGEARETELKLTPEYWGNMIECGATVARYTGCRESGLKLIDKLIGNEPKALNIQEELAVPGTKLIDTGAGMTINKELLEIQAKLNKDLEEINEAHRQAMEEQRNSLKKMLEAEQQRMQERLDKIAKDREELLAKHNADLIRREEQTASALAAIERKLEAERKERMEEQRKAMERAEIREREAEAERVKLKTLVEAERREREESERRARGGNERRARGGAERRVMDEAEGNKFYYALASDNEALVRQLLEKGVGASWRDGTGYTALHLVSIWGREGLIRLLLESGMGVNEKASKGTTALHHASYYGYEGIVRLLLERGADVNSKDEPGRTALCYASYRGHLAVARLLLESGADVNTKHNDGTTTLSFALEKPNLMVVQLLRVAGAI